MRLLTLHLTDCPDLGIITTLSLCDNHLESKYVATCSNNASWLTWDSRDRILYCLDEGLDVPDGSLHSFKVSDSGQLSLIAEQTTISGPVSGVLYGSEARRGLALAHYTGSAVTTWLTDSKGSLEKLQQVAYTLASPGPNPDRQDAPHEHEAILDPTGNFIVVPDLGADLVRVFSVDLRTLLLSAETPLHAAPGSGPRHGVFWRSENKTFFYLVAELANTLTGYEVSYPSTGGLHFKEIFVTGTHGDKPVPAGNAVAEIQLSPDHRFIVVSNRNDTTFSLPNFDPKNSTRIPSDSLATWELNGDGTVRFRQLTAAGGSFPRQFALNSDGSLIAVGLQLSSRVVVLSREIATGMIGGPVASVSIPGQITCVVWDELSAKHQYS